MIISSISSVLKDRLSQQILAIEKWLDSLLRQDLKFNLNKIKMAQEFLGEDNACGQTLLKLVSRGSSIIAELLRLSDYVPSAFWNNPPAESKIYSAIIQDFTYLKNVDAYEEQIYENPDLLELDENFREANIGMLERFYILF